MSQATRGPGLCQSGRSGGTDHPCPDGQPGATGTSRSAPAANKNCNKKRASGGANPGHCARPGEPRRAPLRRAGDTRRRPASPRTGRPRPPDERLELRRLRNEDGGASPSPWARAGAGDSEGKGRVPKPRAGELFYFTANSVVPEGAPTLPLTRARSAFPRWAEGPAGGLHVGAENTKPR